MERICNLECFERKRCPQPLTCDELYKRGNIRDIWIRIINLAIDWTGSTDPENIEITLMEEQLFHEKSFANPIVRCDMELAEKLWEYAGFSFETMDWFDDDRLERWEALIKLVCNARKRGASRCAKR